MSDAAPRMPPPPAPQSDILLSPNAILPTLQKWFGDAIVDMWGGWPPHERRWLLLGCPVWGDYVETLVKYSFSTLIAPENLRALAPCWLVILADAPAYARLVEATAQFASFGITPLLMLVPDDVLALTRQHPSNRYWVLGTAHNILLRLAHRAGAGFHMMAPDHLYGPRYFAGLRRLAPLHPIIAQTGVSSNLGPVAAELEQRRHDRGWIAVPDRDLGDMAWRHLHAQTRAYLMNDARIPDRMPLAHFVAWQGRDAIHTYCCHQNAAWLSPEVCQAAPNFLPATIDTRLPWLARNFYIPALEDEMTFIEVSDASKAAQQAPVGREAFLARCWAQAGFSHRYMPYFLQPSLTPIHPQKTCMSDDLILSQHKEIVDMLWAERPPAWMESLQQMPAPTM